jgi:hypothetical protein
VFASRRPSSGHRLIDWPTPGHGFPVGCASLFSSSPGRSRFDSRFGSVEARVRTRAYGEGEWRKLCWSWTLSPHMPLVFPQRTLQATPLVIFAAGDSRPAKYAAGRQEACAGSTSSSSTACATRPRHTPSFSPSPPLNQSVNQSETGQAKKRKEKHSPQESRGRELASRSGGGRNWAAATRTPIARTSTRPTF